MKNKTVRRVYLNASRVMRVRLNLNPERVHVLCVKRVNLYRPLNNACSLCQPGTSSNATGVTTCVGCSAGRGQAASGQTSCVACIPGTVTAATGQLVCSRCLPGSFGNETGGESCYPCNEGEYSSQFASTVCSDCPIATFNAATSQGGMFAVWRGLFR